MGRTISECAKRFSGDRELGPAFTVSQMARIRSDPHGSGQTWRRALRNFQRRTISDQSPIPRSLNRARRSSSVRAAHGSDLPWPGEAVSGSKGGLSP